MRDVCKKRIAGWCALLCAVCTVFAMLAVPVFADGGYISGSGVAGEREETVTVSFYLSGNPGVWGLKGSVSYDASIMTLESVSVGSVFSESEVTTGELSANPFVIIATGGTIADKTKDGTLISLKFKIASGAAFGDYMVNFSVTQAINANGDDVSIGASGVKVIVSECLHRNTYLKDEVPATEEKEGYSGDSYCSKCGDLVAKGTTTPKVVNTCEHKKQERVVVTEATCGAPGLAKNVCTDCGKELSQEEIPATEHVESGLTGWKAATTTQEGYTGDVLCQVCGEVLEEGSVIPKIEILVFGMTAQAGDTYIRGSLAGLVFVSEADSDTFGRVELDGAVLDAQNYTVEGESTTVTLKPEYLETLADGKHTLTVVSDAGTASAQFLVAEEETPEAQPAIPYNALLIIAIVAVVAAVACAAVTVIVVSKNKKGGRFG